MCVLFSVINIVEIKTMTGRMTTLIRIIASSKANRIKSSSFFWSHWSHASNFFTPGVFVKQNSNRTVF